MLLLAGYDEQLAMKLRIFGGLSLTTLRMAETSSARCVQVSYYIIGGMMIYWLTM